MAVTRQVIMEIGAKHAAGLKTAWKSMGSSMTRIKASGKALANTFLSIKGIIIGALVRGAFRRLIGALREVTEVSGRATEIQSKFRAVFKHLTRDSETWAESFAKSVGRSQTMMMSFMSTLQDTFVPLGYSREAAAGYSKELTKLAIDLASFNDVADVDVIRDLQSALVGSVIVMRKYGVIINESRMQQVALSEGIIETQREMTAQEKVQARMILMLRGTADAQGDAIRTAGEWTNALKGIRGAWFEVRKHIGGFITESPIITGYLAESKQALFDVVEALKKYGPALREAINKPLEGAVKWIRRLQTETRVWVETGGLLETWNRIRVAMRTVVALGTTMYQGLKSIVSVLKLQLTIQKALIPLSGVGLEDIREAYEKIKEEAVAGGMAVEAAWKGVADAAFDVVNADKAMKEWTDKINERVEAIRDAHKDIEEPLKSQLNTAKQISAEQKKQLDGMAKQFGLMSGLEKLQVKYMAEQLKGAKGFEFYERMTEKQREMIGQSRILQAITERRGFGERVTEQYLGKEYLRGPQQIPKVDIAASLVNQFNIKVDIKPRAVADAMVEKLTPMMMEGLEMLAAETNRKWRGDAEQLRAAKTAGLGT